MTRPNKAFTVRLQIVVLAGIKVQAKDPDLAEAIARSLWRDQIANASLLGFFIEHNAVHISLPEEVLS